MKLKYYLRGLGIGIFVSVLIVGLTSGRQKMTDEEVIARAKELGMVESMVLSNMNNGQPQADVSAGEPEETRPVETEPAETQPTETETPETEPIETEPEEIQPIETEPEESIPEPAVPAGETITITIRSGESSVTVSKTLEDAGLVESASAYDSFLCRNGYDRRIRVGTYEIPVGASEEEIAEIIAGRG